MCVDEEGRCRFEKEVTTEWVVVRPFVFKVFPAFVNGLPECLCVDNLRTNEGISRFVIILFRNECDDEGNERNL